jgi:outer membrane murein-binding lipoprotein Lpp
MHQYVAKVTCFALASVWLAGCWAGRGSTPWDDLKKLQTENTDLTMQVERLQAENTQLEEQVQTLSGMDKHVRLDALDTLAEIRIGKYTGLYDKDKDGAADSLIVYVEPMDGVQDYIKAVGPSELQLSNHNPPQQHAKQAERSDKT